MVLLQQVSLSFTNFGNGESDLLAGETMTIFASDACTQSLFVLTLTQNPWSTNWISVDGQDLNQFLAAAANEHGYGSPFVRGDTDDVGPGTSRDVDITDFNALAANFDPTAANGPTNTWGKGNSDGDRDIDITDFNSLAANFSPTGYAVTSQVPEPSMFSLFFVGMGLCICLRRGR